jgi:hypothetical protein
VYDTSWRWGGMAREIDQSGSNGDGNDCAKFTAVQGLQLPNVSCIRSVIVQNVKGMSQNGQRAPLGVSNHP